MDLRTVRYGRGELTVGATYPLGLADLALLESAPRGRSEEGGVTPLTRITNRHHALARLLAVGSCTNNEAGIIAGYTPARISILKRDPSFIELMDFYRNEVSHEYQTMNAQMAGLGEDAVAELRKRVEDEPDKLGANFLLDLVVKLADRTGNGPTVKSENKTTVTFDIADRMKAARARAQEAIELSARDITPQEPAE